MGGKGYKTTHFNFALCSLPFALYNMAGIKNGWKRLQDHSPPIFLTSAFIACRQRLKTTDNDTR